MSDDSLMRRALSRRWLLRTGLATAAGLTVAGLAACSNGDDAKPTPEMDTDTDSDTDTDTSEVDESPTSTPVETESESQPETMEEPEPTPPTEAMTTDEPATPTPLPEGDAMPELVTTTWRRIEVAESPPPRRDYSLVADTEGRRVYLFGGRSDDGALDDLWVFDVDAEQWTEISPDGERPQARFGHNVAFDADREQVIIFGGEQDQVFFSDVWAFDTEGETWSQLADGGTGPEDRYGAGGAYDPVNGILYVSHGFTLHGRFDDTWAFSAEDGIWTELSPETGERPEPRCLMRVEADLERERLVLFGGQSDSNAFLNDLWTFDLGGNGWQRTDAVGPSPRKLYATAKPADRPAVVLFGGETFEGANAELWVLDLTTDTWIGQDIMGSVPMPRRSHDATWLNGRRSMLLFGGQSSEDLNDLWELTFDPDALPFDL